MNSMVGHKIPVVWAAVANAIDDPERPRRIAIVSGPLKQGDRQLIYFYLGRELQNELVYVSPKSGGAVSRSAGEPWRDRLLRLPAFLREGEGGANAVSDEDLQDGFRLTGMFLLRHVLEPRGQGHSDAREGFVNAVLKYRARARTAVP